jgi:hypothetical protein
MADEQEQLAEDLGHEPFTVNSRTISVGLGALLGVMFAALLVVGGLAFALSRIWGGAPTVNAPPGATVLIDQRGSLRRLRETENRLLTEYAWIDANSGVARVPIDRAIQIVSEQLGQTKTNSDGQPTNNP